MSDRIGVMFAGKLEQVDKPEVIYARPCNRQVASFIGGMNFVNARMTGDGGGRMDVDVQGFGALTIDVNPNVRIHGTDLLVGIRPEQLEIGADRPEGYDGYLQGTISDVAFYGESVHYYVQAPGTDDPIAVAVPNYFHTVDHKRGDTVWLGVQNASVIDLGARESQK